VTKKLGDKEDCIGGRVIFNLSNISTLNLYVDLKRVSYEVGGRKILVKCVVISKG
jgi:hypothetical protein